MIRQCLNLMVLALITLLSACDKSSSYQVTHLPFKADKESRWGLIDLKGNPLIEDEFEERPSSVVEDRFYVKNSDGLYEFYTAEKKFKKIGGEYVSVGFFHDGLAPVVEKDKPISYIRPDGSVAFTLDRYNDELIEGATIFQEGRAAFRTKSGKWGYIDKTGKVVIEPKYDLVSLFYNKNAVVCDNWGSRNSQEMSLLNFKGKELFQLKEEDQIHSVPWQGTIIYSERKDDKNCYGLLDQKGEKIIKASTKYKVLRYAYRNMFVFMDSHDKCGLIDRKGNVLIRAKFDDLIPTEDVLIFKENGKYGLLSYEGEKLCNAIYEDIIPFADNQDYTYAKDGDDWILIGKKGVDVRKGEYNRVAYDDCIINKRCMIRSSNIYYFYDGLMVQSDYLDIQAEVDDILTVIHNDGSLDKLSYNTKSDEFVQLYKKGYNVNDLKDKSSMSSVLTIILDLYKTWVIASFNGTVVTPKYKRVWKDSYTGRGHWENEIEDYSYNGDARIEKFILHIELKGKFIKRKEEVHQAVRNWFESRGYTYAANETADDVLSSYWIKNSPSVHAGIHFSNDNNYIRIVTSK